jgi:hypothetical protein
VCSRKNAFVAIKNDKELRAYLQENYLTAEQLQSDSKSDGDF